MLRWKILTVLGILTGFGLAAHPAHAEKDAKEEKSAKQQDSRLLFDGKSLKNWEVIDFGGQGDVRVEEGVLIVDRGEPLTGIVYKGPELPKVNYELSLESQRRDGNDFFLGLTFPVKDTHCSLILGGWGGGVAGLSSIDGFDASENETTDYFSFEKDQWYKVRVRVTDDKIEAWLDDQQIANVDHKEKKIDVRIEMEVAKPLSVCTFQTTGGLRHFRFENLTKTE
ncbi:MAG: DUF1080 domain-containing protein [Planctomycetaceae bacterium]|nr:DUF1080 domain-containing protein [Planctomycetaceae bacterium]